MTTFVLNAESSELPIGQLLQQAKGGSVEVRDVNGNVVACVLTPTDQQMLTYVEALLDLNQNREKVRAALARRGGITTAELLRRAEAAAKEAEDQ